MGRAGAVPGVAARARGPMFMTGLLILLLALYGHGLVRRVDALDGKVDGRLNVVPLHRGAVRRERRAAVLRDRQLFD